MEHYFQQSFFPSKLYMTTALVVSSHAFPKSSWSFW